MTIKRETTPYGFIFGDATIERAFADEKKGWVVLLVRTTKYPIGIQLYVTKTGKVRIHSKGEWLPPKDVK